MDRRGFLARIGLGAIVAAIVPAALVRRLAAAPAPELDALCWSQGVEDDMLALDGLQEPCENCGAPNALLRPIIDSSAAGVAWLADDDGGYEATATSPTLREMVLCDRCVEAMRRDRDWPVGILDCLTNSSLHELNTFTLPVWEARTTGPCVPATMGQLNRAFRRIQGDMRLSYRRMSPKWAAFDAPRRSGFGAWERRVLG